MPSSFALAVSSAIRATNGLSIALTLGTNMTTAKDAAAMASQLTIA